MDEFIENFFPSKAITKKYKLKKSLKKIINFLRIESFLLKTIILSMNV